MLLCACAARPPARPAGAEPGRAADQRLYVAVKAALAAEPRLENQPITVEVVSGVIVLSGSVADAERRRLAVAAARAAPGAKDVVDLLQSP